MTAKKMVPAGTNIAIYGEPANINYFVNTDLAPVSEGAVVNKQSAVKAHTRRRYATDSNPVNVSSSDRNYIYDPGRRNGSAVPGNPFILDDGTEKRAFHYTGTLMALHAYLVGEAAMDLVLYSQSAAYDIKAAE
jgi:hypothetical protein